MNKTLISISVLALGVVSAMTTATPVSNNPSSQTGSNHSRPSGPAKTGVHQINLRLRNQMKLIQDGVRSGKLTKNQAINLRADLKAVRTQEVSYFKQSGKHDLSPDQVNQLNNMLDKNSSVLGETNSSKN